jgi:acid phosphatase family membrane protein YuiD
MDYNLPMDSLAEIFTNYKFLIIPAVVWFIAQALKIIITLITEKRLDISLITSMGGMPSSHSATVCALATTLGKVEGFDSPIFALSLFLAFIVMYDAAGVRRTVGDQSVVINRIIDELFKDNPEFEKRLKEFIGHSRLQIIIGAALGIGLAWWWA